jgi:hypothetical protein
MKSERSLTSKLIRSENRIDFQFGRCYIIFGYQRAMDVLNNECNCCNKTLHLVYNNNIYTVDYL